MSYQHASPLKTSPIWLGNDGGVYTPWHGTQCPPKPHTPPPSLSTFSPPCTGPGLQTLNPCPPGHYFAYLIPPPPTPGSMRNCPCPRRAHHQVKKTKFWLCFYHMKTKKPFSCLWNNNMFSIHHFKWFKTGPIYNRIRVFLKHFFLLWNITHI